MSAINVLGREKATTRGESNKPDGACARAVETPIAAPLPGWDDLPPVPLPESIRVEIARAQACARAGWAPSAFDDAAGFADPEALAASVLGGVVAPMPRVYA